jgi:hypothetical protein
MKGVLIHCSSREYFDLILQDGRLKPSSVTNVESENDYHGSNIFFTLVPEDVKKFRTPSICFYFKPVLMEKYGKMNFRPSIFDKESMKYDKGRKVFPKQKAWFNNAWLYGSFYKEGDKEYKSINYNPEKSLQENIQIFRDVLSNSQGLFNYKKLVSFSNELVIQSRSIPLKNNLLVIYLSGVRFPDEEVEKISKKYPDYRFTNKEKELKKIVKEYYG